MLDATKSLAKLVLYVVESQPYYEPLRMIGDLLEPWVQALHKEHDEQTIDCVCDVVRRDSNTGVISRCDLAVPSINNT
jgi:hypothetical protein